ncbi:hypothetical protein [Aliamphritea spongicola]|nr:hypothetical protein [Aliamphritea spongicola]
MLGGGVTRVEVEAIDPRTWQSSRAVVAAGQQAQSQQLGKNAICRLGLSVC